MNLFLNGWDDRWFTVLVGSCCIRFGKEVVLAALFGIALRALRRRSANARYLVGCLALLMLAVTPLVTFFFVPIPRVVRFIWGTRQTQPWTRASAVANRPFVDLLGFGTEPSKRYSTRWEQLFHGWSPFGCWVC